MPTTVPTQVIINNEPVDVWPESCIRVKVHGKLNCPQCALEGKIQCSPAVQLIKASLSEDQKRAIAEEAQKRGVKEVAKEKDLPWIIVRAWVGAYCRVKRPKEKAEVPALPTDKPKRWGQPPATPMATRTISIAIVDPGDCFFCQTRILDQCEEVGRTPWLLMTPKGRIWVCFACAEGIQRLLTALEINCEVTTEVTKEMLQPCVTAPK